MNPDALRKQVRRVGTLAVALCLFLGIVKLLNSARLTEWFLALAMVNAIWYFAETYRTHSTGRWTLHWYYRVLNGTLLCLSATVGILILFLLAQEMYQHSIGWMAIGILLAVALHQAYRGARMASRRWKSPDDVIESLSPASISNGALPKAYDYSFFLAISVAGASLGRMAGYSIETLFAAILFVLSIPYLLGMIAESRILLVRYFPQDRPFHRS
jgi:hypothetical protein